MENNKIYTAAELDGLCAPEDPGYVAEWFNCQTQDLVFRCSYVELDKFFHEIHGMILSYPEFPDEERRSKKILKLLKRGEPVFPVFIQEHDKGYICEGRHRVVAFYWHGLKEIPVLFVRKEEHGSPLRKSRRRHS